MRFIALSLFFLLANFYAYWCRHNKITANDKLGRFWRHDVIVIIIADTGSAGYQSTIALLYRPPVSGTGRNILKWTPIARRDVPVRRWDRDAVSELEFELLRPGHMPPVICAQLRICESYRFWNLLNHSTVTIILCELLCVNQLVWMSTYNLFTVSVVCASCYVFEL